MLLKSLTFVLQTKSRLEKEGDSVALPRIVTVEKRLLAIPIMYIVLRMWGTTQFFFSLAVSGTNVAGCIPSSVKIVYTVLGILQVMVANEFHLRLMFSTHLKCCQLKCTTGILRQGVCGHRDIPGWSWDGGRYPCLLIMCPHAKVGATFGHL